MNDKQNDTGQNDPWQNDSGEKQLNSRRRIKIFGSTIVLVPIVFFAVGYAIEVYNHHQTLVAIGEYAQACADANEPVELAGVQKAIQGNTARNVWDKSKMGPRVYDYEWNVFGIIKTHKRLSIEVDEFSRLGHVVVTVSQ